MISPDQLKPFIGHPDADVRSLAAEYFSDSWSRDTALLPLVLDARERYGDELFLRNLVRARHLTVDASSLDRLLQELDRADTPRVIKELGRLIKSAPASLLLERREILETHPKLDAEIRAGLDPRWSYQAWETEALWRELLKVARESDLQDQNQNEVEECFPGVDVADSILDVLAKRTELDGERICHLLADPEMERSWIRIYLTSLAGRRRIKEAIPGLIDHLKYAEDDLLIERTIEALAKIGDRGTVDLLLNADAEDNWSFIFCRTSILGDLKLPESESAILELLKSETEPDLRTFLCVSLCELISDRAVEAVRREIATGSQMAFRETAPLALSVATILGQELPSVAVQWKRERNRQQEALKKAETNWATTDEDDSLEEKLELNEIEESRADETITQPIRNLGTRVGRNDRCPCGSGKKYKKCCGSKS